MTLEYILACVCEHFQITERQIFGRSRKHRVVEARQVYCYLSRRKTLYSLNEIGDLIDRDHATVLYSITQVENDCRNYPKLTEQYRNIVELSSCISIVPTDVNLLQMSINYSKSFLFG